MEKPRIRMIFMGKSKESVCNAFKYVIDVGVEVIVVVDNEESSKLRDIARSFKIPTCSDADIYGFLEGKKETNIDLKNIDIVVSFLFPRKIKKPLISLSRLGCINFHSAPLPKYRGWGVYNAAILNNEQKWGVSAHFVDEEFDTGDIIKVDYFDIDSKKETAFDLNQRSQEPLLKLFKEIVNMVVSGGSLIKTPQERRAGTTYNKKEKIEHEVINLNDSTNVIDSKIRAFWHPPFAAKIMLNGEKYSLINQEIMDKIADKYGYV